MKTNIYQSISSLLYHPKSGIDSIHWIGFKRLEIIISYQFSEQIRRKSRNSLDATENYDDGLCTIFNGIQFTEIVNVNPNRVIRILQNFSGNIWFIIRKKISSWIAYNAEITLWFPTEGIFHFDTYLIVFMILWKKKRNSSIYFYLLLKLKKCQIIFGTESATSQHIMYIQKKTAIY